MKKYLLIIILSAISVFVYSQRFNGGIVAGISGSQVDGDENSGYKKLGLIAGGWVSTKLSQTVDMESGIYYINKGSSFKGGDNSASSYKIKLSYIEIPFVMNYIYKEKYIFGAGLSGAYLLKAKLEENGEEAPENTYNYSGLDFSVIGSIGYILSPNLNVKLRYSHSIFTITDHRNQPNQFNNVVTIALYYQLNKR
jgi:hypothetical protein